MERNEGKFLGADNLSLYYQSWYPPEKTRAVFVIVHGLGVHSGIFANLAEFLVARNFAVYGLDLRGHGRSPGQRGYINRWQELWEDVRSFIELISNLEPDLPIFLSGQSLGGAIIIDYALYYPDNLTGLVALSPALGANIAPIKLMLGRIFSQIYPRFSLDTGIDLDNSSRDPQVIAEAAADPLRHTQGTARLATEFFKTVSRIKQNIHRLQTPILILHGGQDRVVFPESSRLLFEKITLENKQRIEYPESYHELHTDLNCQEVFIDLENWLSRNFINSR